MEKPFIPFSHVAIPTTARPGEWFQCKPPGGGWAHAWNVSAANRIMIARAIRPGQPGRVVKCVLTPHNKKMILESGTETDEAHTWSPACDPRRPILSVVIGRREWIIDGWHRARRAVLMGWDELPAFILTECEDFACRLCPCCARRQDIAATVMREFGGRQ
jgi:hypothetical protein